MRREIKEKLIVLSAEESYLGFRANLENILSLHADQSAHMAVFYVLSV